MNMTFWTYSSDNAFGQLNSCLDRIRAGLRSREPCLRLWIDGIYLDNGHIFDLGKPQIVLFNRGPTTKGGGKE